MITPDPIIKTSLHHLSCDKKVEMTVNSDRKIEIDRGLMQLEKTWTKYWSKKMEKMDTIVEAR